MPDFPIIDSHVHFWDTDRLRYPWLATVPKIDRPFGLEDYGAATAGLEVEAMVFVQAEAAPEQGLEEADWAAGLARQEPRIRALVAWAPLDRGRRAETHLKALGRHAFLRGIRQNIQAQPDLDFCLRPDFIEGVRMLADFGLSFDICVDHRLMENAVRLAEKTPDVPMVLNHIGKPAVRDGALDPWRNHLRALAAMSHVWCKLSGVATEADHGRWTAADLRPFINEAVEAFGPDRLMFGSDWPVVTLAASCERWIAVLDDLLSPLPPADRRRIWRDNAARFYRLGKEGQLDVSITPQ